MAQSSSDLLFADPGISIPESHRVLVWTTVLIGYVFYRNTSFRHVYRKTTDGGITWAASVDLFTYDDTSGGIGPLDVWYDRWTRDDTGTKIHICSQGHISTSGRVQYRSLDTSGDTLSGIVNVASSTFDGNIQGFQEAITKAIGGNLYIAGNTNRVTRVFFRSTDGGANWTERAVLTDAAADKVVGLYYGAEADNQDIWAVIFVTDTYKFRVYDDSGDSWASADIVNVGGAHIGWPVTPGVMRHSDDHLLFAIFTGHTNTITNGDIKFFDIASSASITERASIETTLAGIRGVTILLDQTLDDVYVAYSHNPSDDDTGDVFYRKSTDGGVTWETAVTFKLLDDSANQGLISCPSSSFIGEESRVFLMWLERNTFDAFTHLIIPATYLVEVEWEGNGDIEGDIAAAILDEVDPLHSSVLSGFFPHAVEVATGVWALVFADSASDGFVKTVSIDADGLITVVDTLEFATAQGIECDIIHVSGDIYAIVCSGPDIDGFLHTVDIDSAGNIGSVQASLEFATDNCRNPFIFLVAGQIYGIAYQGPDVDGWLTTVDISDDGLTLSVVTAFEFDTVRGQYPSVVNVDGDIWAIAYTGNDVGTLGAIRTVDISTDGATISNVGIFQFDTSNGLYPIIRAIAGDIFVVAYEGPDNDGWLKTLDISTDGVTMSVKDSLEFDTANGRWPSMILVSGDIYAVAYTGASNAGTLKTIHVADDGTIGAIQDTFVFDAGTAAYCFIFAVRGRWPNKGVHGIMYRDATDAHLVTVDIETFVGDINDITGDVRSLAWSRGADGELEAAQAGTLELVVNNADGKYSPENASSVLFPNVLPGKLIKVTVAFHVARYVKFTGKIEKFIPHPDAARQDCYILCVDGFDQLARRVIEAPKHGVVTSSKIGATTQVSGVNITFNNIDPDTIVRASGSFVTDGFVAGMKVLAAGSAANDGSYVIASVVALTLTLDANEFLMGEGPSAGITLDGYGPVGIILDEAGWGTGSGNRKLDAGVDTLDVWWTHKEAALSAERKLAKAEGSFMYVDGSGKFVYEDRHHRLGDGGAGATDHLTSQATFTNTMIGMDYQFSARSVRNIIHGRGQKLTARTVAYVWETQDRPSVAAFFGALIEVWADFANPVTGIVVPVANTDWKANTAADGSGDDETANVLVAGVKYGQALKMTITNTGSPAKKVFIIPGTSDPEHTLRVQAQEYEDNPIFTSVEDGASKAAFGERALDVDLPFKGNFNDILSFAEYELARKKDPQPDFTRMTVLNGSAALQTQMLARKLSDRITVTEDNLGISAQDYFINKEDHRVDMAGLRHQVTWSLARIGPSGENEIFWVLGKAGYSELGQTTVLIF